MSPKPGTVSSHYNWSRIVVTYVVSMMFSFNLIVRGLRKPMNAVKAFMGDLTPFPYLTPIAA